MDGGCGVHGRGRWMRCACRTSRACAPEKKLFHLFFVLVCVTFVHGQVGLIVFIFSYICYNFPYMLLLCLNCGFLFKMFVVRIFKLNQFILQALNMNVKSIFL